MAVPKQKQSKARSRKRAANHKATAATAANCPECGTVKRAHFACSKCGAYDKKRKLEIKEKQVKETK